MDVFDNLNYIEAPIRRQGLNYIIKYSKDIYKYLNRLNLDETYHPLMVNLVYKLKFDITMDEIID